MNSNEVQDSMEAEVQRLAAHEAEVRQRCTEHTAMWGEGPPHYSDGSFEFWQQLHGGRFTLGRCPQCSHIYFPPRIVCPECWAEDAVQLVDTPALGTLVSFTDVHVLSYALRPLAPLRIAVVDLDEGVRVLSWLRGENADQVVPGQRCRIVVETVLEQPRFIAHLVNVSGQA